MIRRATALDIPGIMAVLDWAFARSIYSGLCEIDRHEANRVLTNGVQRHGGKGAAGTWFTVAVANERIEGFVLGVLAPVYHIGDRCTATDLYWIGTDACPALAKIRLIDGMIQWGKAHPKVIEVVCGSTGALGDWEGAGRILERMGLAKYGGMYRMAVAKECATA